MTQSITKMSEAETQLVFGGENCIRLIAKDLLGDSEEGAPAEDPIRSVIAGAVGALDL